MLAKEYPGLSGLIIHIKNNKALLSDEWWSFFLNKLLVFEEQFPINLNSTKYSLVEEVSRDIIKSQLEELINTVRVKISEFPSSSELLNAKKQLAHTMGRFKSKNNSHQFYQCKNNLISRVVGKYEGRGVKFINTRDFFLCSEQGLCYGLMMTWFDQCYQEEKTTYLHHIISIQITQKKVAFKIKEMSLYLDCINSFFNPFVRPVSLLAKYLIQVLRDISDNQLYYMKLIGVKHRHAIGICCNKYKKNNFFIFDSKFGVVEVKKERIADFLYDRLSVGNKNHNERFSVITLNAINRELLHETTRINDKIFFISSNDDTIQNYNVSSQYNKC